MFWKIFGEASLRLPIDRQLQVYTYIYIYMYICVYVCVLPARALYIDQRVVCWSISVAYALRKMLFLNDSPKLSWLWPGPDQQPVPHTHTYIDTNKCTHVHRPARIWSTATVQSSKWSNVPQCNSSRFECTQNAHDLSPCLDCKSLRSLEKSKQGHYLFVVWCMRLPIYLSFTASLSHTVSRSALSLAEIVGLYFW